MITDKHYLVRVRDNQGNTNTQRLTISGVQQEQTLRRRVQALLPGHQVIDMREDIPTAQQLELRSARKAEK